jgi:uncharacterized protein DUF4340
MSARVALVLVILLAVLGGGALLYRMEERGRRPDNAAALGQPLLKGLQAADIATIRITEPKSTLTLERKESGWIVAERAGFPADVAKVREFALLAISLKVGQSEPAGEQDRARLQLDDPRKKPETAGTLVEFNGADGKALAALVVGRKYFKREPDNPDKAPGDGRFVALPGDAKLVYLVADPLALASARSATWIDRTAFQVEKVKSLEVRYPDGTAWRVERAADNADWKLAGLGAGEKLDVGRANAATYSLSLLELADVAPKDVKDTGLDKPTLVNATTLAGEAYAIRVGRLQGDNYYLRFTSTSKKERDKLLSPYTLLVPKSKLDDTLKKRAELLEAKPGRK